MSINVEQADKLIVRKKSKPLLMIPILFLTLSPIIADYFYQSYLSRYNKSTLRKLLVMEQLKTKIRDIQDFPKLDTVYKETSPLY